MSTSLRNLYAYVLALCPKEPLIMGIITSILLTAASFAQPYVTGKLYDDVIAASQSPDHTSNTIMPYLLCVAGLLVFNYIGTILVGILFAVAAHTTITRLRIRMYANSMEQDSAFYDRHCSGEMSSRLINDSGQLQYLAQFTTQNSLSAIIKLFGSLFAMYGTHWKLALIATCISPLNWWFVRKTGSTVGKYGIVQNKAMAAANAQAVETLGAIHTVQSNVAETKEIETSARNFNFFLRIIKFTVYSETVLRFTDRGLSQIRDFVVLAYGMHQVIEGNLTIGSYTAFATYVSLYEAGFSTLANLWINIKSTITSSGRFLQLLQRVPDIHPDRGEKPLTCTGELVLENVEFAYPAREDAPVLCGVQIVAKPGTMTALVGESGAGKSTIGRLIERFYDPTGGRILLDGMDYRTLNVRWLRQQIGFVAQEPVLFDRSIRDNLTYGLRCEVTDAEVEQAAKVAHAHDFIMGFPEEYHTKPGEKGVRISGGQKQRIAIARAVIKNPRLLLLDEATSALDSATEHMVQAALEALMAGRTTVVIAHRLSTVVRADQIIVLAKGVIAERGTHQELSNREDSFYATFMRHQLVVPSDGNSTG